MGKSRHGTCSGCEMIPVQQFRPILPRYSVTSSPSRCYHLTNKESNIVRSTSQCVVHRHTHTMYTGYCRLALDTDTTANYYCTGLPT
ncbi:hypothetical protein GHT06_017373 [Daphnia sinensis]|uniref:Uncharacterized protein n=1 Tax=Daphnia sinensis TaxID=1820382 RepID=A0AAD5L7E5_9CRUS|nr:hypothetical protein GHT06_017373 [Daphnia sinensis]